MGQKSSKRNKTSFNLEDEIDYISEQTGLDKEELRNIYETFAKKGELNKKEFVLTYRKFYPKAIHPDQLAEKVFKNWDADQNGCISFAEFAYIIFLMTKAPKEVKLRHIFNILDIDGSGTLSAQEVVQAVKNAHNILGDLNFDYNSKGIQVFRAMDSDGDLRINQEEFVQACLKDDNLGDLMEKLMSSPELFQ